MQRLEPSITSAGKGVLDPGTGRPLGDASFAAFTNELTDSFEFSGRVTRNLEGNLALAVFGLMLIIVMLLAPGGIQGAFRKLGLYLRRRLNRPQRSQAN